MKFIPLETTSRAAAGVQLGYAINNRTKGAPTLSLSIHPDLVRKLKIKDGDILRLDGDLKEKYARLMPVQTLSKAARRVHLTGSSRGDFKIPWTGLIKEAFPSVESMTALEGAEVTGEGLLFQLR